VWFRYFTGAVQIVGAALVLIPRTCLIGIAILSCTMVGAALIWIFLLHAPGNAPIPLLVLAALMVVGFQARRTRFMRRSWGSLRPTQAIS
jgi:hypothetical protein